MQSKEQQRMIEIFTLKDCGVVHYCNVQLIAAMVDGDCICNRESATVYKMYVLGCAQLGIRPAYNKISLSRFICKYFNFRTMLVHRNGKVFHGFVKCYRCATDA